MADGILLEAGTNEMELLVFRLGSTPFGINVAKVREIIQRIKTTNVPYTSDEVEGTFKLRDQVLTLIRIGKFFDMEGEETAKGEGMIIIVEFSKMRCGILVDKVERIHRLNWNEIEPPSQYLTDLHIPVTGTVLIDKTTVLIVDFESLVSEILGVDSAVMPRDIESRTISRKDARVLLADDSSVLRKSLSKILNKSGYENLTIASDGKQAWDILNERRHEKNGAFDIILTDIEMPQMDGLHLTAKIKKDPQLKEIPVILFSSLITKDNLNKGNFVGADAQVSKPESQEMIEAIERCLAKRGIITREGDLENAEAIREEEPELIPA